MTEIHGEVTHNYDPARGRLRNICDLPQGEAEKVLEDIRASGVRSIKPNYLMRRLQVKDWLMAERAARLGPSPLTRPVYFFLGNYADGLDPSRPASLAIPLAALPPDVLTFTYPDSMASLPLATEADYAGDRYDRFIEVQVRDLQPGRE